MAQKIRSFKDQMSKVGVSPKEFIDKEVVLDDVEVKLGKVEGECLKSMLIMTGYSSYYLLFVKKKKVTARSPTAQQREKESQQVGEDTLEAPLLQEEKSVETTKQVKLGFLTGLVPCRKSMMFEGIVFRGNIFI